MTQQHVRTGLTVLFVLTCVGMGTWLVARDWARVTAAASVLEPAQVLGSFALGLLAMGAMLISWLYAVRACGIPLSAHAGWTIFPVAQLTKYVPGGVWPILAQATLGRAVGASPAAMSSAGAVHLALTVCVALVLGGATAMVVLPQDGWISFAPVLALGLVLVLWPPFLNRLLPLASRTLGRLGVAITLPTVSAGSLARSAGWCAAANLLFALHVLVLLPGPGGLSLEVLLTALAAYALASAAGVLVVLAPAGAGAKEGVLALVLATSFTLPQALVVAIVSRTVLVAVDVLLALARVPSLKALSRAQHDGR